MTAALSRSKRTKRVKVKLRNWFMEKDGSIIGYQTVPVKRRKKAKVK